MNFLLRTGARTWLSTALLGCVAAAHAGAQRADPTAVRRLDLSGWGMVTGSYTGLGSTPLLGNGVDQGPEGRNVGFSAGADLGFYSFLGLRLGGEVRGKLPIKSGQVVGQKDILAGLRITREPSGYGVFGRFRPYADVLAGRGSLTYQNGGYLVPGTLYLSSNSAVYAGGGGFEYDFSRAFSLKADALFERWNSPVAATGRIYAKQGGVGIVYRYGTGRGPR